MKKDSAILMHLKSRSGIMENKTITLKFQHPLTQMIVMIQWSCKRLSQQEDILHVLVVFYQILDFMKKKKM